MHNNTEALGKENITRLVFQYSLPATVGMVVAATYNIADTIFISRLGSEAIAALSIGFHHNNCHDHPGAKKTGHSFTKAGSKG